MSNQIEFISNGPSESSAPRAESRLEESSEQAPEAPWARPRARSRARNYSRSCPRGQALSNPRNYSCGRSRAHPEAWSHSRTQFREHPRRNSRNHSRARPPAHHRAGATPGCTSEPILGITSGRIPAAFSGLELFPGLPQRRPMANSRNNPGPTPSAFTGQKQLSDSLAEQLLAQFPEPPLGHSWAYPRAWSNREWARGRPR
jgi:hypothetical protein